MRTVIWAPALRRREEGRSTVEVGAGVGISSKAALEIGRCQEGGLDRALDDDSRPGRKPLLAAGRGRRMIARMCGLRSITRTRN